MTGHARQLAAQTQADAIGAATDRVLGVAWRALLAILRQHDQPGMAALAVQRALRGLPTELHGKIATGLEGLATASHERAAKAMVRELPAKYLHAALSQPGHLRHIREANEGLLSVALSAAGIAGTPPPEDDTAARNLIQTLLFPPPDRAYVYRLIRRIQVGQQTWEQRLYGEIATRFHPAQLAGIISAGYHEGLNQRQIAQRLLPAVEGLRASARRIGRTYGMAVAHQMNQDVATGLGDLVIGYTVHSVHGNPYSRPWHVERDGTEYWKEPKAGQKGYYQMPNPPFEAEDPAERPAGTPHTAFNCLCWISPILRPVG